MSAAMTLVRDALTPSFLIRPISLPELIVGTAAEGAVSITMTDIEGTDGPAMPTPQCANPTTN